MHCYCLGALLNYWESLYFLYRYINLTVVRNWQNHCSLNVHVENELDLLSDKLKLNTNAHGPEVAL